MIDTILNLGHQTLVMRLGWALLHLTVQELEALLTHELAHIRRHDYLVNLLQSVVEIFFFICFRCASVRERSL